MTEQWKPVLGYEGLYEVSDRGRVRSVDRVTSYGRKMAGRVRSLSVDPGGANEGHPQ